MDHDEIQRRHGLQNELRLMLVLTFAMAVIATWVVVLNVNEKAQVAASQEAPTSLRSAAN